MSKFISYYGYKNSFDKVEVVIVMHFSESLNSLFFELLLEVVLFPIIIPKGRGIATQAQLAKGESSHNMVGRYGRGARGWKAAPWALGV